MIKRFNQIILGFAVGISIVACNSAEDQKNSDAKWLDDHRHAVSLLPGLTIEITDNQRPWIEFQSEKGIVSGFSGCNNFSGKFTLDDHTIKFENIAVTKKMCPNMEIEDIFISHLNMAELIYANQDGDLVLATGEREELIVLKP